MEEYITRAEADRLIKEEVSRQLREQRTDEIKAVRVDVASEDVLKRFDRVDQALLSHSRSIDTLQTQMNDVTTRLDRIENTMATKQDLATLKTAQDAHFDQIEKEQKEQHELLHQILRLLRQTPPES